MHIPLSQGGKETGIRKILQDDDRNVKKVLQTPVSDYAEMRIYRQQSYLSNFTGFSQIRHHFATIFSYKK
jgi:hypothetical protein